MSETTSTVSPFLINPLLFKRWTDLAMLASMSSERSTRRGVTPHCRLRAILTLLSFVNANMGGFGRLREITDAIRPCLVYTNIASIPKLLAAIIAKARICKRLSYQILNLASKPTHCCSRITDLLGNLVGQRCSEVVL